MQNIYRTQSGQSLLLVLVFTAVLITTMVFVFNASQMLSERQNAKMIADHAAYATGLRQARLLNLNAYINRTQVANQLAIAQLVSMGSWLEFVGSAGPNAAKVIKAIPPAAFIIPEAQALSSQLKSFNTQFGTVVQSYGYWVALIDDAQFALNAASSASILTTPRDFLDATGKSDYSTGLLLFSSQRTVNPAGDTILNPFIKRYTGNNRVEMANVINSSKSGFVQSRKDYDFRWLQMITPLNLGFKHTWLSKKGGAELVNLNEWKAVDTLSLKSHSEWIGTCGRVFKYPCAKSSNTEDPILNGTAAVSESSSTGSSLFGGRRTYGKDLDPNAKLSYGRSREDNPNATNNSQKVQFRPSWDVNTTRATIVGVGVPKYYDLVLKSAEPTIPLTVYVKKNRRQLSISNRNSNMIVSGQVNALDNFDALQDSGNGNMVAMTKSIVFFQRPQDPGATILLEQASLYSPYWLTRITDDVSKTERFKMFGEAVIR